MNEEIVVEMMTSDLLLWRCLHGGPLSRETIDRWPPTGTIPWERYRDRNRPLLAKLTEAYGSCAVVARRGEEIVGQVRFYPTAVWDMEETGYLCLQQEPPAGPTDDCAELDFPSLEKPEDRVLKVHCLQTSPAAPREEPLRRQGLTTRMVQALIRWAGKNGWRRIEVEAFEDLPLVYEVTGSAGISFWEKLGFRIVDRFPHPHLQEPSEFREKLVAEAVDADVDPERATDSIVMHLDLS